MKQFDLKIKNESKSVSLKNIPVLRQAFIVAGTLIVMGLLLMYYVDANFIVLPVLVGFGLLFSGTFGICPMVAILNHMPWNR